MRVRPVVSGSERALLQGQDVGSGYLAVEWSVFVRRRARAGGRLRRSVWCGDLATSGMERLIDGSERMSSSVKECRVRPDRDGEERKAGVRSAVVGRFPWRWRLVVAGRKEGRKGVN